MAAGQRAEGDRRPIPRPAPVLGAGGAVTFDAFALAAWLAPPAFAAWSQRALVAYAMVVLSFVGALLGTALR